MSIRGGFTLHWKIGWLNLVQARPGQGFRAAVWSVPFGYTATSPFDCAGPEGKHAADSAGHSGVIFGCGDVLDKPDQVVAREIAEHVQVEGPALDRYQESSQSLVVDDAKTLGMEQQRCKDDYAAQFKGCQSQGIACDESTPAATEPGAGPNAVADAKE